jgi:hypothetical protein
MRIHSFILFLYLFHTVLLAQVKPTAQTKEFDQITPQSPQGYKFTDYSDDGRGNGPKSSDVMIQAHLNAMRQMGSPGYSQYKRDVEELEAKGRLRELYEAEESINFNRNKATITDDELKKISDDYKNVYQQLNAMLTGKSKLSIIDASYAVENVYGNPYLSKQEYKNSFKESADYIHKWLSEHKYPKTPHNLHLAIQQFMNDTTSIQITLPDDKQSSQRKMHYPYKYDYTDYDGKQDYRNYFATKCAATGTGQCYSLPLIYLGLCEELGITANLSFAPFHSFIKFTAEDGKLYNYEPTSGWVMSDAWYQEYLFISKKSKETGIYLAPLTHKQVVANYLVDLATSYMKQTGVRFDTSFVNVCLANSKKYFPKNNNINAHLLRSTYYGVQIKKRCLELGLNRIDAISQYPDLIALNERLAANESLLRSIGYIDLPQAVYENLLSHQNNGTNLPNAKKKKSLYKLK